MRQARFKIARPARSAFLRSSPAPVPPAPPADRPLRSTVQLALISASVRSSRDVSISILCSHPRRRLESGGTLLRKKYLGPGDAVPLTSPAHGVVIVLRSSRSPPHRGRAPRLLVTHRETYRGVPRRTVSPSSLQLSFCAGRAHQDHSTSGLGDQFAHGEGRPFIHCEQAYSSRTQGLSGMRCSAKSASQSLPRAYGRPLMWSKRASPCQILRSVRIGTFGGDLTPARRRRHAG